MFKLCTCCIAIMILATRAYTQQVRNFQIDTAVVKFPSSKFNNLQLVDSRKDTTNLGIVRVGAFDRKALVKAKPSLSAQLSKWFNSYIDQSAGKGELVLQLRKFSLDEVSGTLSHGYCTFRAELYRIDNQQYIKVKSIDTLVALKSIDVTKELLEKGAETITNFISTGILNTAQNGTAYSRNDLDHLDSLEKKQLKLYNVDVYAEGVYMTYDSFKAQKPDKPIIVNGFDVNMADVKTPEANGKLQKVSKQSIYAIVFKGQPYIATKYDYYSLNKENDEFVFTGKASAEGNVILAGALLGVLGSVLAANGSEATYEMKIDHVNGSFIKIKEIPDPVVTISKNEDY